MKYYAQPQVGWKERSNLLWLFNKRKDKSVKIYHLYYAFSKRAKYTSYILPTQNRQRYVIYMVPTLKGQKYAIYIVPFPKRPKNAIQKVAFPIYSLRCHL